MSALLRIRRKNVEILMKCLVNFIEESIYSSIAPEMFTVPALLLCFIRALKTQKVDFGINSVL
jgi:hypothetical protein